MNQAKAMQALWKTIMTLPKSWISKPMADYHPNDPKSDKLMIIAPNKFPKITLWAGGNLVHELKYFGTYQGGGHRYYAYEWGYKIARKALRLSGKPTCEVWAGNKYWGSINAGFREGSYR